MVKISTIRDMQMEIWTAIWETKIMRETNHKIKIREAIKIIMIILTPVEKIAIMLTMGIIMGISQCLRTKEVKPCPTLSTIIQVIIKILI
jgi:hypothetical protein